MLIDVADDKGVTKTMKAVFKRFTEGRRKVPKSKDQEYEIEWLSGFTSWVTSVKLTSLGFGKLLKQVEPSPNPNPKLLKQVEPNPTPNPNQAGGP